MTKKVLPGYPLYILLFLFPLIILDTASVALAQAPALSVSGEVITGTPPSSTAQIHPLWILPFILLLACIALMPFINKHWWEHNYPKVSFALAAVGAAYYFFIACNPIRWLQGMEEYVSFIILLAALYVISGGILVSIARKATPFTNCVLLLFGAVIANIFGTTGAAMLLIRPYIRINKGHLKPYHIVFFIFVVANVGGALTPIGDPPLFLGYLQGVPFWWIFEQTFMPWAIAITILLAIFFVIEYLDYGKTERHHYHTGGPVIHILGVQNFLFIALVIFAVFRNGFFDVLSEIHNQGLNSRLFSHLIFSREILMIIAALGSRFFTGKHIYQRNEFTYAPIKEVAILFVGIFSTMIPALQWLNVNADRMPLKTPGQFYYTSGVLSSVLDNAPTYLTFLQVRLGMLDQTEVDQAMREIQKMSAAKSLAIDPDLNPPHVREAVQSVVVYHSDDLLNNLVTRSEVEIAFLLGYRPFSIFLVAISVASVFFGALTYIGNGPNFMVKSIAESAGAKMPGFITYITHYSLPILLPLYILIWLLFFYHH